MQLAQRLRTAQGVDDAAVMMGTESNKAALRASDLLSAEGEAASPSDLIIAVRAANSVLAEEAIESALASLDKPALPPTQKVPTAASRRPTVPSTWRALPTPRPASP
jgi:hypothetical protein